MLIQKYPETKITVSRGVSFYNASVPTKIVASSRTTRDGQRIEIKHRVKERKKMVQPTHEIMLHALYKMQANELLIKQRDFDVKYDKDNLPVIRTSNIGLVTYLRNSVHAEHTWDKTTVARGLKVLQLAGFIIDKKFRGTRENFELRLNQQYCVFITQPHTSESINRFVAELTIRYENQHLTPLSEASCYLNDSQKIEKFINRAVDNSVDHQVVSSTTDPELSDISHKKFFSKNGRLTLPQCQNDAGGTMSQSEVGDSRNSTTSEPLGGVSSTQGESTDPRFIRLYQRTVTIAAAAKKHLFKHLSYLSYKQELAMLWYYLYFLMQCKSNREEETLQTYFITLIERHAAVIDHKMQTGVWKKMQLPTTYYWSQKQRSGMRDARRLIEDLSLSKAPKLMRDSEAENAYHQWLVFSGNDVKLDNVPEKISPPPLQNFEKEKASPHRRGNLESFGQVLQRLQSQISHARVN